MKHFVRAIVVAIAALVTGPAVNAAPPGWELRNGTWVPIVEPGTGTPEAQVAKMIKDLNDGLTAQVIKDVKEWIKRNGKHPLVPQALLLQGDAEVLRGNKYSALYPYEDLLNNYPTSDLFTPTLEREYHLADAFLNGYKRKFLGMRILPVTDDAIELLDRIQDRQPKSVIAEMAGMRAADYFFNTGRMADAADEYSDFLRRYGAFSQYARHAEVRRAEAYLGSFRGLLFDFTPLIDARQHLSTIIQAFPQTAEDIQARAIDDRIYQLEGEKDLEIARYYYRAGKKYASGYYYRRVIANWPDTTFAATARKEMGQRNLPEAVFK
jgi:outer membrane protein assembly factor BamD (BamD/ComL family)